MGEETFLALATGSTDRFTSEWVAVLQRTLHDTKNTGFGLGQSFETLSDWGLQVLFIFA